MLLVEVETRHGGGFVIGIALLPLAAAGEGETSETESKEQKDFWFRDRNHAQVPRVLSGPRLRKGGVNDGPDPQAVSEKRIGSSTEEKCAAEIDQERGRVKKADRLVAKNVAKAIANARAKSEFRIGADGVAGDCRERKRYVYEPRSGRQIESKAIEIGVEVGVWPGDVDSKVC
jgi:hypothetical protein